MASLTPGSTRGRRHPGVMLASRIRPGGTDVVGGEATARPSKRGRAQTNENVAGDLKLAAPPAIAHRCGGEHRRSGGRTETTARRGSSAWGRGKGGVGERRAHPCRVPVLGEAGGGQGRRRASTEFAGRPRRRRPRRRRLRPSRVDSSLKDDEEDQALLLPHPAEIDGGRSDGKRRVTGAARVRVPGGILQRERRGKLEGDRGEREGTGGVLLVLTRPRERRGGAWAPRWHGGRARRPRRRQGRWFLRKPPGSFSEIKIRPFSPLFCLCLLVFCPT